MKQKRWLRLIPLLVFVTIFSVGLTYLLQELKPYLEEVPADRFGFLPYLGVFGIQLLCNLTIVVPVPIATAVMIAAASQWHPALIALAASLGGALGELSGYYAGYLGKKTILPPSVEYGRVTLWMRQHGIWAVFVLAFQPVIPFDIAGVIAGISKMPIRRFLPAVWAGKFPKYILFNYFGIGLLHLLPWF